MPSEAEKENFPPAKDSQVKEAGYLFDRRGTARHPGCGIVQVMRMESAPSIKNTLTQQDLKKSTLRGIVVDISKTGISFLLPDCLSESETIHLRIFNPRTERHSLVSAIVTRSTPMENNHWRTACQLTSKLTIESLSAISQSPELIS